MGPILETDNKEYPMCKSSQKVDELAEFNKQKG